MHLTQFQVSFHLWQIRARACTAVLPVMQANFPSPVHLSVPLEQIRPHLPKRGKQSEKDKRISWGWFRTKRVNLGYSSIKHNARTKRNVAKVKRTNRKTNDLLQLLYWSALPEIGKSVATWYQPACPITPFLVHFLMNEFERVGSECYLMATQNYFDSFFSYR